MRRRPPPVRSRTSSTSRVRCSGSVSGQHAVTEVEDVARPTVGAREHVECLALDDVPGSGEHGRVEVPLDGAVAGERPAVVEWQPPVEPDHVAARCREVAEQVRGARPEVDRRHVDGREDPAAPRRDAGAVVRRRERPDPRVEELDDVRARAHLGRDVRREHVCQLRHQRVPRLRLGEHQRLRPRQLAARAALDEVAGDREGAAAEPDHRLLGRELRADEPHGLEHRRERLVGDRGRAGARRPPRSGSGARRPGRRPRRARRRFPSRRPGS